MSCKCCKKLKDTVKNTINKGRRRTMVYRMTERYRESGRYQ